MLAEVNELGEVKSCHRCDVWGSDRLTSGQQGDPKSEHAFVGSLGHTTSPDTGLIYMRARYYDPAIGRFISEDPAMSGTNWYAYCESNPTNALDITGNAGERLQKLMALSCGMSLMFLGLAFVYMDFGIGCTSLGLGLYVAGIMLQSAAMKAISTNDSAYHYAVGVVAGSVSLTSRLANAICIDAMATVFATSKLSRFTGGVGTTASFMMSAYIGEVSALLIDAMLGY